MNSISALALWVYLLKMTGATLGHPWRGVMFWHLFKRQEGESPLLSLKPRKHPSFRVGCEGDGRTGGNRAT